MTSPDLALPTHPARRSDAPTGIDRVVGAVCGAAVWGVVALAAPPLAGAAVVMVPGAVAAVHDVTTRRVPDRSVLAVAAVSAAAAVLTGVRHGTEAIVGAIVCSLAVLILHLLVHLASPSALGFGDVKLAAALAGALGAAGSSVGAWVLLSLVFTAGAAGFAVLSALMTRRRDVPHAVALVASMAVTLIVAHHLPGVVPT